MDKSDFWMAVTLWSTLMFGIVALGLSVYGCLFKQMLWIKVVCLFGALFSFSAMIVVVVMIYILLKE